MPLRVVIREDESLQEAVRRLHTRCREAGILVGRYVRMKDRNRQKYFHESKGVKQRRRRHIAAQRRRIAEMDRQPDP